MQIVIFVGIGAAQRIVVFQMQTDTKELSKWKGRVEKRLAANTRLQDTRIPSEMEVPPHYKLFVHCLHFFYYLNCKHIIARHKNQSFLFLEAG